MELHGMELTRHGLAWHGLTWHGLACHGLVYHFVFFFIVKSVHMPCHAMPGHSWWFISQARISFFKGLWSSFLYCSNFSIEGYSLYNPIKPPVTPL